MRTLAVLIAALLATTAAAQEAAEATARPPVSYARQVRPILQAHCYGCHQPAKANADVVLSEHARLLADGAEADPLVVPGDPDASWLIDVVTAADGERPAMPDEGAPLSDADLDLLRRWIAEGAHDDTPAGSGGPVAPDRPPIYHCLPVVTSVAYSPDGALLAVAGHHEVLLHRVTGSPELVARLVGLAERIEALAFSPDGRALAVVGGSPGRFGELQLWDVASRELTLSKLVTDDCLFGVSWSPDGALVAFGATDAAMRAVRADTGEQVLYQSAHDDWVLDTVFSTDASHLVTVGRDRSMKLVLVAEQQFIDNITSITPGALRGGLMAVDRHPTRDELLVGGADGEPRIFRMYREKKRVIGDDFNLIRAFERVPGRVFAVQFSADGQRVVAGSSDRGGGALRAYDTESGAVLWTRELPGGVYAATFRPDGEVVVAAGFAGLVYLLDAASGETLTELVPVPLADETEEKQ